MRRGIKDNLTFNHYLLIVQREHLVWCFSWNRICPPQSGLHVTEHTRQIRCKLVREEVLSSSPVAILLANAFSQGPTRYWPWSVSVNKIGRNPCRYGAHSPETDSWEFFHASHFADIESQRVDNDRKALRELPPTPTPLPFWAPCSSLSPYLTGLHAVCASNFPGILPVRVFTLATSSA